MKKNDFILIVLCLVAALSVFGLQSLKKPREEKSPVVEIIAGGEVYGIYDLNEDQEVDINGTNKLVIKDGEAFMAAANCPDKLCTYQNPISKDGECIICLPNRIIATVKSDEKALADSVAN